ncbi:hypothetical protein CEXT_780951 [Caerostris extrusa]|uniref:Uncharacterized protein n=1 Tax=Caerostris extrusa TaxID=172846 RepID=A0AAV4YBY9_CAEEX|nr:hypothetical protein CEXT_780951 [Caerostris extrusa]
MTAMTSCFQPVDLHKERERIPLGVPLGGKERTLFARPPCQLVNPQINSPRHEKGSAFINCESSALANLARNPRCTDTRMIIGRRDTAICGCAAQNPIHRPSTACQEGLREQSTTRLSEK